LGLPPDGVGVGELVDGTGAGASNVTVGVGVARGRGCFLAGVLSFFSIASRPLAQPASRAVVAPLGATAAT